MGKLTEEAKLMRRIEQRFMKGIVQYGLIEEGDKILVGLSGGKDSLALLELLARRSRIYKPRFSVVAICVRMPKDWESLSSVTRHRSTLRRTTASLRVSFAPGTVGKPCLQWPKSRDVTRLPWGITWMTFWRLC